MTDLLTGTKIRLSYTQLLHVDGGLESTEKPVLSGSGVASALRLGTGSASLGNMRVQGNVVTPLSGSLQFTNVSIVGGSISGIEPLSVLSGGTGAGSVAGARSSLGLQGMALQDPASVAITGGSIGGEFVGTAQMSVISDKRYGSFWSMQDQTAVANTPTVLTFDNEGTFNSGLTLATASTVQFTTTGVYLVTVSIQFANADTAEHDVSVWFRRNGADLAASRSMLTVPKAADGGVALPQISIMDAFTAGQTLSIAWAPETAQVTVAHTDAITVPYTAPSTPSVILTIVRIA